MKSQQRAVALFVAVAVGLTGVAVIGSRWFSSRGVDALPNVPPPPPPPRGRALGPVVPGNTGEATSPRLLQQPTLSKTQIAFTFAGELWTVPREGGDAQRLVTGQLVNSGPVFSPDGSQLAFTGVYDGNADVYVVSAYGGEPRRLTHHPAGDSALGWTPDGTKILFRSYRATARDLPKLFTVATTGGFPDELPLPSGDEACFSPDGKRLAYVPFQQWQPAWKKYRGGQTTPVWLADLADSRVTKVPRTDSNDRHPMWIGDTVYFVSDRNGPFTLFGYDPKGGAVRELVKNTDGFDIRHASAGPDAIVYEQLGKISIFDLASGTSKPVPITISADLPQVRPRFEHVGSRHVLHAAISPTGKRAVFEARGEILSVPAEKGDVRNLTRTPGAADRDPAFSPDGKWVAWLSDESGEYALHFRAPDGQGPVKILALGAPPSYFYDPRWSPDGKKLLLTDKRLNLWVVEVDHPVLQKIDTQLYEGSGFDPSWSPDSQFVAYTKQLANHFDALFVHSLKTKSSQQVTDGRSEAYAPRFDRSGKYLWFLASTDVGIAQTGGMTAYGRPVTSTLYAMVLKKTLPSPVAPESDEEGEDKDKAKGDKAEKADKAEKPEKSADKPEKADKAEKGEKKDKPPPPPVVIDFAAIDQRIIAMPVDRTNYVGLEVGGEGVVFLASAPLAFSDEDYLELDDDPPGLEVSRFDLKARKAERLLEKIDSSRDGLQTFSVSADGNKMLFEKDKKWFLVGSDKTPKPGDGALKLDDVEVWIDPRAEWRQIFREVWRIERDFLYDPGAHGLDLAAAEKIYGKFLAGIAGRDDLNTLLEEGLGNLVMGHVWAGGGSGPRQGHVSVGLLGADYRIEGGRYRFARILAGEGWNPKMRAPLTQPGVDVKEGDFLLAVNGQELKADDDVHRLFLGLGGKQTVITVGPNADGTKSRQVTVVPARSEGGLRLRTWMEDSRKLVDKLSAGRVGYVYIPDTAAGGFTNFNRYYFSQVGKEAVVLDERFNHGGQIADYMINILKWQPIMGAATREGADTVLPAGGIFGPKVMLANQMSGSGGDALPWLFKRAGLGPLVGVRTWGGLVGIGGYPRLVDGGSVTAPRWALYGTKGEWEVENVGIAPDVEVEQDPFLTRQGHDPQLERGVQLALEAIAKAPPVKLVRPAYPNYGARLPRP